MKSFSKLLSSLCAVLVVLGVWGICRADVPATVSTNQKVEIFVTSWCPYCQRLEAFLKAKKVKYTRYDIDKDSRGKSMHEKLGGGGVPVIKIGSLVIRGFDEEAISSALEGPSNGAKDERPEAI